MHLAHPLPSSPTLRCAPRRRKASGLRRWLQRLRQAYGRAGMLELHR